MARKLAAYTNYKWCFVPLCTSTSVSTPSKIFITVPKDPKSRQAWLKASNRDLTKSPISPRTVAFCCEDHFNLEEDMENWIKYKLVGGKIRMKKGVVPHMFDCQPMRKEAHSNAKPMRGALLKEKSKELLKIVEYSCTSSCGSLPKKAGDSVQYIPLPILEEPTEKANTDQKCQHSGVYLTTVHSIKQECDQVWSIEEESSTTDGNPSTIKSEMVIEDLALNAVYVKEEPLCWENSAAGDAAGANGSDCENNEEDGIESGICIQKQEPCWDEAEQVKMLSTEQMVLDVEHNDEKYSPGTRAAFECEENLLQNILKPEFVSADKEPWDKEAVEVISVDPLAGYGYECSSTPLTFSSPECMMTYQKIYCDTKEGLVKEHRVECHELPSSDKGAAVQERTSGKICIKKGFGDIGTADSVKFGELSGSGDVKRIPRSEKTYECDEGGVKSSVRPNIINHFQLHMARKAFSCNLCESRFFFKSHLMKHMRSHTGEKPYPCLMCGSRFSEKGNLKKHVKIHTVEKPFSCHLCEASFSQRAHLNQHMSTHPGEKPHACTFCEAKFSKKKTLNKHIRIHTGKKQYACNMCEARFLHKTHLNDHIKTHTGEKPYACTFCEGRFSQKGNLNKHIRTHTGQKQYACNMCEARFGQKTHLNGHIKTHTGEKPYACTFCDARFSMKGNLKRHFTTHNGRKTGFTYLSYA